MGTIMIIMIVKMLGMQIIKMTTIIIIVIITKGAGDADGPQEKAVESS